MVGATVTDRAYLYAEEKECSMSLSSILLAAFAPLLITFSGIAIAMVVDHHWTRRKRTRAVQRRMGSYFLEPAISSWAGTRANALIQQR
jgi:hypothetical protein